MERITGVTVYNLIHKAILQQQEAFGVVFVEEELWKVCGSYNDREELENEAKLNKVHLIIGHNKGEP